MEEGYYFLNLILILSAFKHYQGN
uniref:Uncharacterized protein n=1 Tax=Anguilla anguilla TaxID=7936 RepID=A0A0E9VF03_ANGAN